MVNEEALWLSLMKARSSLTITEKREHMTFKRTSIRKSLQDYAIRDETKVLEKTAMRRDQNVKNCQTRTGVKMAKKWGKIGM